MPSFIYQAVLVNFENSVAVAARDNVELRISTPTNGGFKYRIEKTNPGDLPVIKASENDAFSVTFNGESVLGATMTSLGKVVHGGKTTFILAFEDETGPNTDTDLFVVIGGAKLPSIKNLADWNAFNASITSIGPATGALGPNTFIKFKDLKTASSRDDDLVFGSGAAESFSAGAGADVMFGGGGNDTLSGGAGDDEFFNEPGKELFKGGSGFDEIDYSSAAQAIRANWKNGTVKDGFGKIDSFAGIELIRGSLFDDTFKGNGDDNQIRGLKGADTIDGGGGTDTARYDKDAEDGGTSGVRVDLDDGTAKDGFGDTDTLKKIENIRGTDKRDVINGNSKDNFFRGQDGNDRMNGREGDDVILGEEGDDDIRGKEGNDTLDGGNGSDTIDGGDGKDVIIGGRGKDDLTGGNNGDTFVFSDGFGKTKIRDFNATSNTEKIDLSDVSRIKGLGDLRDNHMTQKGDDVIIDDGKGNTIKLLDVDMNELGSGDFIF